MTLRSPRKGWLHVQVMTRVTIRSVRPGCNRSSIRDLVSRSGYADGAMFTPRPHKPATSTDVAHLAGVSRATVSYVLNDKPDARIPEETRQRVHAAAVQLGYTPDSRAQRLRSGGVEGLLIPAPILGFGGAMDRAFAMIAQDSPGAELPTIVHADHEIGGVDGARVWARYRPEAVFVESSRCDEDATEILRLAGVRALLLFGPEPVTYAPSLVIDQTSYGHLAVQHLVTRGHRRLVWLRPTESSIQTLVAHRLAAAEEAALRNRVVLDVVDMDADPLSLRDWAHGLRYRPDAPTAAIAYDDRFAFAAVRALVDAGLRVPDDIAVIGADDYATSAVFIPSITTISFDASDMANVILDGLERMRAGEVITVVPSPEPRVIRRESS
ncbi:LacI family DNA-binding transcriptional regulator [Nocardia sp. NPDC003963]